MKKIIALLLSVMMLMPTFNINVSAEDYTTEEKEAAEQLFEYLSPSDERVANIYSAYKAKDYRGALKLYRNYFIDKLRAKNVGQLGWHDSNIAGTYVGMADILCGKITVEQFADKYDGRAHYDYLEWWGNPAEEKPVNWIGGIDVPANGQENGQGHEIHFRHLNKLPGAFWTNNGDEVYIKKYLQILDDFCLNHKKVTDQYLINNPSYEPDARFWMASGKYAQGYLWRHERMNNTMRSIAYFAKLLPGIREGQKPEWADVGLPVEGKLSEADYELFDHVVIAHYAYSMIKDHLELSQNVLQDGFLIANQHNEGVLAFARVRELFDEFSPLLEQYDERLAHAMDMMVVGIVLPDGSLTERSFNYNESTVEGYGQIVKWMESSQGGIPEYAKSYENVVKNWDRLMYGYRASNGRLPHIGNGGNTQEAEPIWRDGTAYKKRLEEVEVDENADYTSVYFPFGGYGTMISGRDLLGDMSLNFYNNDKQSDGHIGAYANAVTLTAYGRPLIATGGTPWYGEGFAPENQLGVYEILNEYFEEGSTYKGSTLIVNGANQAKSSKKADGILGSNWMSGENFDFADGTWSNGYTSGGKTVNSAVHNRSFIFVKQAGLFIIEDETENLTASSNKYSQIWRMPCYSEDVSGYTGFTNEQVVLDKENNVLKTNDTTGPNIWISEFSSNELDYVKYYGQLEPKAIGWSRGGTGGERLPAADVHVSWTDEAKETTKVASVLDPVKNTDTPYKSKTDLSDKGKGLTAFSYVTDDDIKITYYSSVLPQEMVHGDIKTNAELLLVVEQEGKPVNAIVTGAEKVVIGEKELLCNANGFEFTISDEDAEILNTISVPTNFKWVEREDGSYYPQYDSMPDAQVKAMIEEMSNKINALRILTYSDSQYLVSYSDKLVEEIKVYLPNFSRMPNDEMMQEYVNTIVYFVTKNTEIAQYYNKVGYSDKIIRVFKKLFDECVLCAKEYRDTPVYYNAYKGVMQSIIDSSKSLSDSNVNIAEFEAKLTAIEN